MFNIVVKHKVLIDMYVLGVKDLYKIMIYLVFLMC